MSDHSYVDAVLSGDREAFGRLIEPHVDLWLNIARSWVGNQQDAEDAVQEALVQCFRNLGQFRGDAQFSTWATRIVIRQCHRITEQRGAMPADGVLEGNVPGFDGLVALQSTIRETLSPDEYRLFHQAVVEGRSWQELARASGERPGTLKTRWWRMKKRLRQALEEGHG